MPWLCQALISSKHLSFIVECIFCLQVRSGKFCSCISFSMIAFTMLTQDDWTSYAKTISSLIRFFGQGGGGQNVMLRCCRRFIDRKLCRIAPKIVKIKVTDVSWWNLWFEAKRTALYLKLVLKICCLSFFLSSFLPFLLFSFHLCFLAWASLYGDVPTGHSYRVTVPPLLATPLKTIMFRYIK